jgi:putative transport protein
VPPAARQLVRDLGILLLVAETGVRAGQRPIAQMSHMLAPTLLVALAATLIPIVLAALLARRILRLRPVEAWGSIGGGMTSSAALVTVKRAADSNEPAISYATAYAVASVLAAVAGRIVVWLI